MGRPIVDRTGKRYGKLTVLSRHGSTVHKESTWLCKCDCGNSVVVRGSHLAEGQKGCGCIPSVPAKELTGRQFGQLTVIERAGSKPSGDAAWLCLCQCGETHVIAGSHLTAGDTTTCGKCQPGGWKHGYARHGRMHPLYSTWLHMRDRCLNPKFKQYKDYGGRGIQICEKWLTFKGFLEDVKDLYIEGRTIDRIDPDGNYEPENVRWATRSQQQLNRRKK